MTVKLIGVISGKKVTESLEVRVKNAKGTRRTETPLPSRMKLFVSLGGGPKPDISTDHDKTAYIFS